MCTCIVLLVFKIQLLILFTNCVLKCFTGTDPLALPVADALAKIAEAEGDHPSTFSKLAPVLASLTIRTLAALLDCGEKKWAEIERLEKSRLWFFQADNALVLKSAVESLGPTLKNLQKEGKPVPIDPALIGSLLNASFFALGA